MCAECDRFGPSRSFTMSEFNELHEGLYFNGIRPGLLNVVVGSLQYGEEIDCLLECATCGQRIQFYCIMRTGGRFERVE